MKPRMKPPRGILPLLFLAALLTAAFTPAGGGEKPAREGGQERPMGEIPSRSTADHSRFEILQQEFPDGPAVTAACLTCHTEASKQVMATSHWTWLSRHSLEDEEGRVRQVQLGKRMHVVNNFCIALVSNWPRCTSCHAGYGWKDSDFDFGDPTRVDCLVCHADTKIYEKYPAGAGHPVYRKDAPEGKDWPPKSGNRKYKPVDLAAAARSVGTPTRDNCGSCHFFGGGGEGVKHGDMDKTLSMPGRSLDVHMAADGVDFRCQKCHTTKNHVIAGRHFENPAYEERKFVLRGLETNLLACESCHSGDPHPDHPKLNDHSDKVSCQACHIPTFARERPTKMWWDWSKAGDRKRGVEKMDVKGEKELSYHFKKGEFVWAKDEVPDYIWMTNKLRYTFLQDRIDDETPVREKCDHRHNRLDSTGTYEMDHIEQDEPVVYINRTDTHYDTPDARIWPAKIHRGIQPYDRKLKRLVVPKLFPSGPDKAESYWKSYDWNRAIAAGMKAAGLPFSGELGWIQTEMIWPLKHMVAPKEDALACEACHHPEGRLVDLKGFYMPGRDRSRMVDLAGIAILALSLLGVLGHGLLRIFLGAKE